MLFFGWSGGLCGRKGSRNLAKSAHCLLSAGYRQVYITEAVRSGKGMVRV